jgi:uncharacterized protein (TIGR03084 family)
MAMDLAGLVDDLAAETEQLDRILRGLDGPGWDLPTPAAGWLVRDQVSHLAWFDDAATTAASDPDRFRAEREIAIADPEGFTDAIARRCRDRSGPELLDWFHRARADMVAAYLRIDPATRVPWYGPDFGVASALTARIMETWAHGQDVADACDAAREPTTALRHVAHLGVRTFANSYLTRGLEVPAVEVTVVLRGPDGARWQWGADGGADRVEGSAVEFCAVVTRRRRLEDTGLVVTGPVAAEWMGIAQAFAGGAGDLRPAGLPPIPG